MAFEVFEAEGRLFCECGVPVIPRKPSADPRTWEFWCPNPECKRELKYYSYPLRAYTITELSDIEGDCPTSGKTDERYVTGSELPPTDCELSGLTYDVERRFADSDVNPASAYELGRLDGALAEREKFQQAPGKTDKLDLTTDTAGMGE